MLLGLIVLSITLAAVHLWHEQNAATLARALVAEREQAAATERLTVTLRHANDIVFLTDETGRILEANERALEAYGFTLDELRALPPGGLRAEPTSPASLSALWYRATAP